jgi:HNH endonuclease
MKQLPPLNREGLLTLVSVSAETECWNWKLSLDKDGYPQWSAMYRRLGTNRAHRVFYTLLKGPIPEGLELDHTCKNRMCVNPAHLDPVTSKVNSERGGNFGREQTHCMRGHEFSPENTYVFPPGTRHAGQRLCRECNRIRTRRNRPRRSYF